MQEKNTVRPTKFHKTHSIRDGLHTTVFMRYAHTTKQKDKHIASNTVREKREREKKTFQTMFPDYTKTSDFAMRHSLSKRC